eukprot:gene9229-10825_t
MLNPAWNEPQDEQLVRERFDKAMTVMGELFLDKVDFYGKSWLPARDIVLAALNNRAKVHRSEEIILLEPYCPFKEHSYYLERQLNIRKKIKFAVFQDTSARSWRVQAINIDTNSFALRCPLPVSWCGKVDDDLSKVADIEGCTFVHANGFIGGNLTKEGALKMAIKALQYAKVDAMSK